MQQNRSSWPDLAPKLEMACRGPESRLCHGSGAVPFGRFLLGGVCVCAKGLDFLSGWCLVQNATGRFAFLNVKLLCRKFIAFNLSRARHLHSLFGTEVKFQMRQPD